MRQDILTQLPKERIFEEFKKLFLKSKKPSKGFKLLKELGTFDFFFASHAPNEETFLEILSTLDALSILAPKEESIKIILMLAAICFSLTQTSYFLSKLTNEKELLKKVFSLACEEMKISYTNSELFRLATRVNIEHFLILNQARFKSTNPAMHEACKQIEIQAKKLNIFKTKAVAILKGRDILACGVAESREFSKILKDAYEAQMDASFGSHEEAKKWLVAYLKSN